MLEDKGKDLLPLLVMLESVGKIRIYSDGFNEAKDFFQADNQAKFNASLLLMLNIGEQCNKLSSDLKIKHKNFPFQQIKGLRNRIAHDYTGIDFEMVFDIAKNEMTALSESLIQLLNQELPQGTFDLGELEVAKQSPFYKHIDFNKLTY